MHIAVAIGFGLALGALVCPLVHPYLRRMDGRSA
jgi:hypothetical protein